MKFDPELVRQILTAVEDRPPDQPINGTLQVDDIPAAVTNRHCQLLIDDGYIAGAYQRGTASEARKFFMRDLTMKGHEFMANARNNTVWKKVMAEAKTDGTSLSMTLLSKVLEGTMKKYLGVE